MMTMTDDQYVGFEPFSFCDDAFCELRLDGQCLPRGNACGLDLLTKAAHHAMFGAQTPCHRFSHTIRACLVSDEPGRLRRRHVHHVNDGIHASGYTKRLGKNDFASIIEINCYKHSDWFDRHGLQSTDLFETSPTQAF